MRINAQATSSTGSQISYILSPGTSDRRCYSDRFSRTRCTEKEILLLASFTQFLLRSGERRCDKSAGGGKGQPQPRNSAIPGEMNQIGADSWRKSAEDGGGQTIGERETRGTNVDGHDLRQEYDHGAVVAAVDK